MIVEHAHLRIAPKDQAAFEAAAPRARSILLAAPGCQQVSISKSVDHGDLYLLRVVWDALASHLEVFPHTPQAAELADLIAVYFAGEPRVVHFHTADLAA